MKNISSQKKRRFTKATLFALIVISAASCKKDSKEDLKLPDNLTSNLVTAALPTPPATISNGLVSYYTLANTVFDFSGNNHGGSLFGHISYATDRSGNARGAYGFDGSTAYITVADKASLRLANTDFTLNAWVKLDSYNPALYSTILSKRASGSANGWFWGINGATSTTPGAINYIPGLDSAAAVSTTIVAPGGWHMVTSIYSLSGSQLSIYVDGVLSNTVTGISSPNASATALMYIGREDASVGTSYFKGALNDIRIYKRAITTAELNALYATPDAPTAGLLANWPLNNVTRDVSGNNNHGTTSHDVIGNPNGVTLSPDRFGDPIGSYYFNGNDWMTVPNNPALRLANTSFTVNAWVKMDKYGIFDYATLISQSIAISNKIGWYWAVYGQTNTNNGRVLFQTGNGAQAIGLKIVTLNTWHMITCDYDLPTQKLSIYIDGVLDTVTPGVLSPSSTVTTRLTVAESQPRGTYVFQGGMNDVRIYNRALSTSEIGQLYGALN